MMQSTYCHLLIEMQQLCLHSLSCSFHKGTEKKDQRYLGITTHLSRKKSWVKTITDLPTYFEEEIHILTSYYNTSMSQH